MNFLYCCPTCKTEHGGQTPSIKATEPKLCDKCKPIIVVDNHMARLNYATMVSGQSIYSELSGEHI
jgi:hypothetical protein